MSTQERDVAPDPADATSTDAAAKGARGRTLAPLLVVALTVAAAAVGVAVQTGPTANEIAITDPQEEEEGLTQCDRGNWPHSAFGEPKALRNDPQPGVYAWVDFGGWHIRGIGGAQDAYTGQVYATGNQIALRSTSDAEVRPNGMEFTLPGNDPSNGVDFTVGCEFFVLTFELSEGGQPVPASAIFLGESGTADSNPVILQRLTSN